MKSQRITSFPAILYFGISGDNGKIDEKGDSMGSIWVFTFFFNWMICSLQVLWEKPS
jgi:hypothetical protein